MKKNCTNEHCKGKVEENIRAYFSLLSCNFSFQNGACILALASYQKHVDNYKNVTFLNNYAFCENFRQLKKVTMDLHFKIENSKI